MKERERQVHPYEPVFDGDSRLLILGSFPSVKSRENGFFYGHPQNRFWKVIAALTKSPEPLTIPEKREMLLKHHIAIWDVIASCEIAGSSDSSITDVTPTDLRKVFSKCRIEDVFANGTTAKRLYDLYQRESCGRDIILLPSTSPANAVWTLPGLIERWGELLRLPRGADGSSDVL